MVSDVFCESFQSNLSSKSHAIFVKAVNDFNNESNPDSSETKSCFVESEMNKTKQNLRVTRKFKPLETCRKDFKKFEIYQYRLEFKKQRFVVGINN